MLTKSLAIQNPSDAVEVIHGLLSLRNLLNSASSVNSRARKWPRILEFRSKEVDPQVIYSPKTIPDVVLTFRFYVDRINTLEPDFPSEVNGLS